MLNSNAYEEFEKRFEPYRREIQERAEDLAQYPTANKDATVEKFTELVEAYIENFERETPIDAERNRTRFQRELEKCQQEQDRLEEELKNLRVKKSEILAAAEDSRFPLWYWGGYLLVMFATFCVFGFVGEMLFGEQGRIIPWLIGFLAIGGAHFVKNLYKQLSPEKRHRLYKVLNWSGLIIFILLAIAYTVGRFCVQRELDASVASESTSLFEVDSLNDGWMAPITTLVIFVLTALTELCFGSSLLIGIYKRQKPKDDLNAIEKSIDKVKQEINLESEKANELASELDGIEGFKELQQAQRKKETAFLLTYLEQQFQKVRTEAITKIMSADDHVVIALAKQVQNLSTFLKGEPQNVLPNAITIPQGHSGNNRRPIHPGSISPSNRFGANSTSGGRNSNNIRPSTGP